MNEVGKAIRRLNYQIDKAKRMGLYNDVSGALDINFYGYITKSGRISKTLAKSTEQELMERLQAVTDYLKGAIAEYQNIPDNIYDIWQNVISDYYRFISEFGADALAEIAPITTSNIRILSKGDEKEKFWRAVEKWRFERTKVFEYADEMRNAEPFTDF